MDWTIEKIAAEMKEMRAPRDFSEMLMWLGAEYALVNRKLTDILMEKPSLWNELRRDVKSDTSAERVWQATQKGMRETEYRHSLKSIEKMMQALKAKLEIDRGEARNQF
jgi:hypothetical protein